MSATDEATRVVTDVTPDGAAADHDAPAGAPRRLVESLGHVTDTAADEIRSYLRHYAQNGDPESIDDVLGELDRAKATVRCLVRTGKSPEDLAEYEHRRMLSKLLMEKVNEMGNAVERHMTRFMDDPNDLIAFCDAGNIVRNVWRLFKAYYAVAEPGERWKGSPTGDAED